jgi:hypothetical protein
MGGAAVCAGQGIEVSLETRRAGVWRTTDPQTVLQAGDAIRFGFRSAAGGYLYVYCVSSSGEGAWLFPRPGQGQMNRVEPRADYVIPGFNGSFVVGGSAGFDTVYWVLSPVGLDMQIPAQRGTQPSTLRPRCSEGPLKARGLCLDGRAGASPVRELDDLPFALEKKLVARDLTFRAEDGVSRVSGAGGGIVVYQFRVAHQ